MQMDGSPGSGGRLIRTPRVVTASVVLNLNAAPQDGHFDASVSAIGASESGSFLNSLG